MTRTVMVAAVGIPSDGIAQGKYGLSVAALVVAIDGVRQGKGSGVTVG